MIHSTPSLRGRGFHIRRIRRRRQLVHHGRVLVLVAVLLISIVLLSVRVSNFVLFCSLGFLACGQVGFDLLRIAHIVGIVVLLFVCLPRLFSALQLRSLSRLRVDFCACSPRPRLGTLLSPGPFYHSGLGKTSVPLVLSSPSWNCSMSFITSLCTISCT